MSNDFDAFIEKLQNQIFEEAKEAFGKLGFQRKMNIALFLPWKLYRRR